ncbi:hypothetical protein PVAP13_3NG258226 [Panicum virgatum]|uniref:Uncharacterized protein n=1 Tax=Panicum virgatum TaxID=38727 RepID=A0A8T0UB26_PANVG|nr:hypothetical protein PVAP13_3NG258226 [Panicum virgatum]
MCDIKTKEKSACSLRASASAATGPASAASTLSSSDNC